MSSILVIKNKLDGKNVQILIPVSNIAVVTKNRRTIVIAYKDPAIIGSETVSSCTLSFNKRNIKKTFNVIQQAFVDPGIYKITVSA